MLSVQHDITIGSTQFKSGSNSRLIALQCEAAIGVPVNICRMTFTMPSDLSFTEGDAVVVKIGYNSDIKTVFTGIVHVIDWHIGSVTIEAQSRFQELAALRVNTYFENAFAGDIIKGLASETEISVGRVQPGARFAFFAVGNNQSAWQYGQTLARQCGFDFFADTADKLVFSMPLPTGLPTLLRFGKELLTCRIEQTLPTIKGIEVYGESPASFGQGPPSSSWFTKQEVKGSGGDSDKVERLYIPSARAQETATLMATALWQNRKPKKKGMLSLLGNAALSIGALIIVSGMPSDAQNGTYKIVGFKHQISRDKGFITQVYIEEMA
jgi:phage protein D